MPAPKAAFTTKSALTAPHIIQGTPSEALDREIQQWIADRAYQLYEESGRQDGNDERNWRQAESEVMHGNLKVHESGTWLALSAVLPDSSAEDVQICVDPSRVTVKTEKDLVAEEAIHQHPAAERRKAFWAVELPVEVEPSTASASLKHSKLNIMVKKRKASPTALLASQGAR